MFLIFNSTGQNYPDFRWGKRTGKAASQEYSEATRELEISQKVRSTTANPSGRGWPQYYSM